MPKGEEHKNLQLAQSPGGKKTGSMDMCHMTWINSKRHIAFMLVFRPFTAQWDTALVFLFHLCCMEKTKLLVVFQYQYINIQYLQVSMIVSKMIKIKGKGLYNRQMDISKWRNQTCEYIGGEELPNSSLYYWHGFKVWKENILGFIKYCVFLPNVILGSTFTQCDNEDSSNEWAPIDRVPCYFFLCWLETLHCALCCDEKSWSAILA